MSRFEFLRRFDWWLSVIGGALIGNGLVHLAADGTGWLRIAIGVIAFAVGVTVPFIRHSESREPLP